MDYSTTSGAFTFLSSSRPVSSQQCVDITVVDDSVQEPLEMFYVKIDNALDTVVLAPKLTRVEIEDNDSEREGWSKEREEGNKGREDSAVEFGEMKS